MADLRTVDDYTEESQAEAVSRLKRWLDNVPTYTRNNGNDNPYTLRKEILIIKRQPTTRAGSNYFTFHIMTTHSLTKEEVYLYDITGTMAEALGYNLNAKMDGTIYQPFGNMDMGFHTVDQMMGILYGHDYDWQDDWTTRYI
tara:strand:+ start:166 stop:591 length:426 start_codon:yes stop_codon:yes gene_type:complete